MIDGNESVSRRDLLAGGALVLTGLGARQRIVAGTPGTVSFARHDVSGSSDKTLRVAACQVLLGPDVQKSCEAVLQWLERAAADHVDVVAFPEASLCGYAGDAYWKSAKPEEFAAAEARVVEASRRLGIAVVLGTVHWESDRISNDLLVIADIRIKDATGAMARRAIDDETILKSWLRDGTELVSTQNP